MRRHGRIEQRLRLPALLALASTVLLTAGPVAAEPVKIGYIDMQRIMDESVLGQKANTKLRKDFESRAARLKNMEENLKKKRQELDSKGSVMSRERRLQREEEYRRDLRELRRARRDNTEEFNIKRKQMLVDFYPKIVNTVKVIGKEMGYTLILRKEPSILLYTTDQVDLTSEVIARLNAEAPAK